MSQWFSAVDMGSRQVAAGDFAKIEIEFARGPTTESHLEVSPLQFNGALENCLYSKFQRLVSGDATKTQLAHLKIRRTQSRRRKPINTNRRYE